MRIVAVLATYDYPRAFLAVTDSKEPFVFLEEDDSFENFSWIVVKTDLEKLNSVNNGYHNFQYLFTSSDEFYRFSGTLDESTIRATKIENFDKSKNIKGSLIVDNFRMEKG